MAATLDRICRHMTVRPTANDRSLTLTITVTAYDNGMISVDRAPVNVEPDYDALGWPEFAHLSGTSVGARL